MLPTLLLLLAVISPSWQEETGNSSTVTTNSYVTKEGCKALLKDSSLCDCDDYEITCETIQLITNNKQLYEIQCNMFDPRGFGYIPPLQVGNIGRLVIHNCAIPNAESIKYLLSKLGVTNYTELVVYNLFDQNKEDRGEVLQQYYKDHEGMIELTVVGFRSKLPANFLANLPALKKLTLKGSSDLPAKILHPLTNLTSLSIMVRNMDKVSGEIFAKQLKLQSLTINCYAMNRSVEMSAFGPKDLWHLTELHTFQLINCGDNVPTEMFWKAENLNYLGITSNISYLSRDFLKSQKKLLTLKLQKNNIARLPDQLFHHSPLLLEIHLAYNNLDRIQSGLFDKLQHLMALNLEHNPITTIAPNAFTPIPTAHIYVGNLFKTIKLDPDWIRNTNATICEEEFNYGVCLYCQRFEYLDHFSDTENCNKVTPKIKDLLSRKHHDLIVEP
ncbi:hypothetical protein KR009_009064 [Drosophila setifemur]|nr:hypothetical protein KR009_009064 [Drosophila setifemur]